MNEFKQEIETIKKGCGKLYGGKHNNDWVCGDFLETGEGEEGRSLGHRYICNICQAQLETAQKLKIIHDKEIDRLLQRNKLLADNILNSQIKHNKEIAELKKGLELLEKRVNKITPKNCDCENCIAIREGISKLKQELK